MRLSVLVLLAFTLVLGVLSTAPLTALGSTDSVVSYDQHQQVVSYAQDKKIDLEINVNKGTGGGGKWYVNPMWVAIGGLAVLVLLALIVMAFKGGGTTVVK